MFYIELSSVCGGTVFQFPGLSYCQNQQSLSVIWEKFLLVYILSLLLTLKNCGTNMPVHLCFQGYTHFLSINSCCYPLQKSDEGLFQLIFIIGQRSAFSEQTHKPVNKHVYCFFFMGSFVLFCSFY